jgi:mono/diheme cytochrome c family protein
MRRAGAFSRCRTRGSKPLIALRTLLAIVAALAGTVGLLASCASQPAIDPAPAPTRASFDPAVVVRGAQLEAIGDCRTCHTAPGGRAFAGGRRIETPFGAIYSTNITPDRDTGIGAWTEPAFVRAMREGVDRAGHHLYPVFPYDHFDLVSDDDLHALYAFLMTRSPVAARAPPNELTFPIGFRPFLAGWKALYLHPRVVQPQPNKSDEWNRGAYLVEGLGHCGACHTPRNVLGAEKRDQAFAGGRAEGWDAPALGASSSSPVPWTRERLIAYLRNDAVSGQGIPAGPMLPVAHDLAIVPEEDVDAIATYVASKIGEPSVEQAQRAKAVLERVARDTGGGPMPASTTVDDAGVRNGAALYDAACAVCHDAGRGVGAAHAMHLAESTSIWLPGPTNLLHIVQDGVRPRTGERGRWMPAFRGAFTPAQLADLARYLRAAFGPGTPWRNLDDAIRDTQAARADG